MKPITIQEAIKEILKSRPDFSKNQLSVILGCTHAQIYNYANGKTKRAGIDVVYNLYKIYNIVTLPYTTPIEIETSYKAKYGSV